jgi:two-component system, OmpR family, response regulator
MDPHQPHALTETPDLADVADRFGVAVVGWPDEASHRVGLARAGVARLLVVAPDVAPPPDCSIDEDWVRLPITLDDAVARLERVVRVVRMMRSGRPTVVDGHLLRRGALQVHLTPAQAVVMNALLEHDGHTVDRATLCAIVWPDGSGDVRALDDLVHRMRQRVAGLGIVIRNVRGRGFALDPGQIDPDAPELRSA